MSSYYYMSIVLILLLHWSSFDCLYADQVAGMSVAQLREEIEALGGCIDGCYERRFSIKALSRLC